MRLWALCGALAAGEYAASFASGVAPVWPVPAICAAFVALFGFGLGVKGCGRCILPPDGFVAASGDGQAQALRVRRDGRIVARAVTAGEYVYLDGGGELTDFEEGACDGVMIRVRESDTVETVQLVGVTRLALPYEAERVEACDAAGKAVEVRPETVRGRTVLAAAAGIAQLRVAKKRTPEVCNVTLAPSAAGDEFKISYVLANAPALVTFDIQTNIA